jgi:clavaminate synthase
MPLVLHTEMAHHLRRPDFVLLACSPADHDGRAGTTVAAARAAPTLLGPEDDQRLRGHGSRPAPHSRW